MVFRVVAPCCTTGPVMTRMVRQVGGSVSGRWVEWQQRGAPGWWVGVHDDPAAEVRARSLKLLRKQELKALREHRRQSDDAFDRRRFGESVVDVEPMYVMHSMRVDSGDVMVTGDWRRNERCMPMRYQ